MGDDGPFLTLVEYMNRERAYGAQCLMCRHQLTHGNRVVGCLRFENSPLDADTSTVLAGMLFQAAARKKCVALERLEFGPDAYRAQDLPEKG